MHLEYHQATLSLRHAFTISRSTRSTQPALVVSLSDGVHTGYGEATANTYYQVTMEGMIASLEQHRALIENGPDTPEAYWQHLLPAFGAQRFLFCALDQAMQDLCAKQKGLPLYEAWGLDPSKGPMTTYTIGIDTVDNMVAKMLEFPWPLYKVKLGTDRDLQIMEALRKNTEAAFTVDANCGWTPGQTLDYAAALKDMGVLFIEQPLPADQIAAMPAIREQCPLPLIADESCRTEADVDHCAGAFHGINIKLMKCGGPTPALRMIQRARELDLSIMVGCMTESSIGIASAAHLLPLVDYADLDGPLLLKDDLAEGLLYRDGYIHLPDGPGIGLHIHL